MAQRLLAPAGVAASLREFSAGDAALVAETFGDGSRASVLLHGIGMGRSVFADLAAHLAGRVIGIDLPGFGEAPEPRQPLSMPEHADLVAGFLRESGESAVLVIGHSMGCQVAAELAVRHPDLVAGLVLAGPTVDSAARSIRQQMMRLLRDLLGERPAVLWRGAREYLRGGPNLWRKMRVTVDHPAEEVYAAVRAPTLVLRGEHDRMAPQAWCATLAETIPEARLAVIPDHGHGTLISDAAPAALAMVAFAQTL